MRSIVIKYGIFIFIGAGMVLLQSHASNQAAYFAQGIAYAKITKDKPTTALNNFKPEKIINNYTSRPTEVSYQAAPEEIKPIARQQVSSSEIGKNLLAGNAHRKEKFNYPKNANSAEIKAILQNSDSIYDAATKQFADCTKKTHCTTTYQIKTCEESPTNSLHYCSKHLDIQILPKQYETHFPLSIHIETEEHYYAGTKINVNTGHIDASAPHDATVHLKGNLPASITCEGLLGKVTALHSKNRETQIDAIAYPSCQNGWKLNVHVTNPTKRGRINIDIDLDMTSTKIVPEPVDRWNNGCSGLESANCSLKQERCIEENTVHDIQGIKVKRACWHQELTYQCGMGGNVQACLPLREAGCQQIRSTCRNKKEDTCLLYEQTLQCPYKQCTDVGLICNGETYCLDGDCVKQQHQADGDFQRSISALSVAHDAGKSFSGFNSIFTGERKTCNKVAFGFINCCTDTGWGKDIHLAQCSLEEKDLSQAKENLQAVYIGEYCHKNTLGICMAYHKAYCVFPSKLARIIQVQGRRQQLGINFGDPEHANCSGLTREQFAALDLGKLDFSDFYSEISKKQKIENNSSLSARLEKKVKRTEQEKMPNE